MTDIPTTAPLVDSFGRTLRDLRISVTDRCNFRCLYCLPETEEAANFYRSKYDALENPHPSRPPIHPRRTAELVRQWKPRHELLSFEEIERVARLFLSLGIRKLRLTGGEPLLRSDLPDLVARLARLPGVQDLAMTTNGFHFERHAVDLRNAGLRRVSFSLDSLDRDNFRKMTGRDGLDSVLRSIQTARELGFQPVKVNAVVIRGLNDHEIEGLAAFAQRERITFRFIEFMPLDSGRAWLRDLVVPGREILRRIGQHFDLEPVAPTDRAETARRWRLRDGSAEIGIIAPVTEPFCGHCNRIRLTADGQIRTCLFSRDEQDLKSRLRGGHGDAELIAWLRSVAHAKEERHHIGEPDFAPPQRSMSCIGG